VISKATFRATGAWHKYEEASATVTDPGGKHDLYFVFVKNDAPSKELASLDWIEFEGGNEIKVIEKISLVKTKLVKSGVARKSTSARSSITSANKTLIIGKSLGSVLIAKSDCYACHKMNQKLVGPAYADVAKRYKNQPGATNSLVDKILKGGAGKWGQLPMTPHPQLSKKDATEMVKYILSLKK
jgi:cytochrome c